jgi:hypothetical protein
MMLLDRVNVLLRIWGLCKEVHAGHLDLGRLEAWLWRTVAVQNSEDWKSCQCNSSVRVPGWRCGTAPILAELMFVTFVLESENDLDDLLVCGGLADGVAV